MGYLKFSDDIEPSQEAIDWLEKVNAIVTPEVDRVRMEMLVFGYATIGDTQYSFGINQCDVTPDVFGRDNERD